MDESTRAEIRKLALKNAYDYGKADFGSVLSKAIAKFPSLKPEMQQLREEVKNTVDTVNLFDRAGLEAAYAQFRDEFKKADEEKAKETSKPKMVLEGAVAGQVVTRLSPEPSGYMHIGHVKQALLSMEFARIYSGKLYRYFDDTNPEKCRQEYVDAMKRDHDWLGIRADKEYYASDYIEQIYLYARQLVEAGKAYGCMCERETVKKKRFAGEECEHRQQSAKANEDIFNKMLSGSYGPGEAIIRFKGDMKSANTVMRDPAMLRIETAPHYRQGTKYRVWPLYDFNTPIIDSMNGITDIIRSKEYELRDELSATILKSLGMRVPRMHLEARLNVKGNTTHKREIRKMIEDKVIESWDDPRLMTIMALRRRGLVPEAIKEFVLRFGMSKTDGTVPLDMLLAENRKIIDRTAKHLFMVTNPVRVTVADFGPIAVKMPLHPVQQYGDREYQVGGSIFIDGKDADEIAQGEAVRLKELADVRVIDKGDAEIFADKHPPLPKSKVIQWVPSEGCVKCTVTVPHDLLDDSGNLNPGSLEVMHGLAEGYVSRLGEHETVQFERFGYCILDDKEKMSFIFISK